MTGISTCKGTVEIRSFCVSASVSVNGDGSACFALDKEFLSVVLPPPFDWTFADDDDDVPGEKEWFVGTAVEDALEFASDGSIDSSSASASALLG